MGVGVKATEALRLRDSDAMRATLRELRRLVDIPLAFGGLLVDGEPVLVELDGARTKGLRGLRVRASSGLGGRAFVDGRPRSVDDYGSSQSITHEYDGAVLGEGITSLLAIPLTVFGKSRGLIYLGRRDRFGLADDVLARAMPIISSLAGEVRIRDEVDRRMAAHETPPVDATPRELSELREAHAELRSIAAAVGDAELATRIRDVGTRLAFPQRDESAERRPLLAPRELDVLSLVALGCGNAEIAARLSIGSETVRSYLRNAMRKLDAHTRLEAVVIGRRLGELI